MGEGESRLLVQHTSSWIDVILSKVVSWSEDGITLEADPRHVELIQRSGVMGPHPIQACGSSLQLLSGGAARYSVRMQGGVQANDIAHFGRLGWSRR